MSAADTPVMQQHARAKRAHPDCIIFFRLGDFYEMFGEDAVVGAKALDLTLTSRNKGKPDEIPMAGVPHHAAHVYIARLLARGHQVALCEQMADPKLTRGIVPREVVRVITRGTWTESDALRERENSWLVAVHFGGKTLAAAWFDLSTGELLTSQVSSMSSLLGELSRFRPKEVLLSGELEGLGVEPEKTIETLRDFLGFGEVDGASVRGLTDLASTEAFLRRVDLPSVSAEEAQALAQVLSYAEACFCGQLPLTLRASRYEPSGLLALDPTAIAHLELVQGNGKDKDTSLLSVLDKTQTAPGGRLLRRRLLAPSTDLRVIQERLDQVELLLGEEAVRTRLRAALLDVTDLERLLVRVSMGTSSPKDLGSIRRGLRAAADAALALSVLGGTRVGEVFRGDSFADVLAPLEALLSRALVDRPPAVAKEGEVFLRGYDAELDRWDALRVSGNEEMARLETELRERTGLSQLRVRFTRVFGWYAEVSRSQAHRVPETFRRKQTVATGERFTLPELEELASRLGSAEEEFRRRELTLLEELRLAIQKEATRIHRLTAFLAEVDVASALAQVASEYDYVRPELSSDTILEVREGRHPVVERYSARSQFVPNDLRLDAEGGRLWLLSGPNMAGKSTFLRQAALIVILAQMGSYVPARFAHVGLVDRVLSRVGASDNLAQGESTFMVEMRETANILRSATRRSLLILDEVGRGTSTFDGLSIAWAVVEYLRDTIGCRSLFATHYHELSELGQDGSGVENHSAAVEEHEGGVVFLHRIVKGAASRSYGVFVAQLAGLPEPVLARSRVLLQGFERGGQSSPSDAGAWGRESAPLKFHQTLAQLNLDGMTGIEALLFLRVAQAELKARDASGT